MIALKYRISVSRASNRAHHRAHRLTLGDYPLSAADRRSGPTLSRYHAGAALGWKPRTELQDRLARTIAYFDDLLSGRKTGRTKPA
jgi:nucleoside-diphosphate-sugar epimerase